MPSNNTSTPEIGIGPNEEHTSASNEQTEVKKEKGIGRKGQIMESLTEITSSSLQTTAQISESAVQAEHLSTLPLVSLSKGLDQKAESWTVESWVALSLTLDGRDKITKIVQYGARIMAWWFVNLDPAHAQRFKDLYKSISKSRGVFRLGRSIDELQKLRSMGLLSLLHQHLRFALQHDDAAFSKSEKKTQAPAWKIRGSALKILGLLGFWTCDNVSFLASTGFLDNHKVHKSERITRRNYLQTRATTFAFRSYFLGSLAGLIVNWKSYWDFRQNESKTAQGRLNVILSDTDRNEEEELSRGAHQAVKETGEKQFVLFLALLKSVCDVLVFSNNTGIDLHKKYRGKKMNEGFHCVCGLLSASTVLYNNFPSHTAIRTSEK